MHRHRLAVFVLLVLSVSAIHCGSQQSGREWRSFPKGGRWIPQAKPDWVPKADPRTGIILNLPFTKIVTSRAVVPSSFLLDCLRRANETRDSAFSIATNCPASFICSAVHEVRLQVSQGSDDVQVSHPNIDIQTGACILWWVEKLDPGDTTTPFIEKIDFIDSEAERQATGKSSVSFTPLGDHCINVKKCVVYFGFVDGNFTYEAAVRHGTKTKYADPDVNVDCTGCGEITGCCGENTTCTGL